MKEIKLLIDCSPHKSFILQNEQALRLFVTNIKIEKSKFKWKSKPAQYERQGTTMLINEILENQDF